MIEACDAGLTRYYARFGPTRADRLHTIDLRNACRADKLNPLKSGIVIFIIGMMASGLARLRRRRSAPKSST